MKCKSVACIWSGSPSHQKVTATAALNQPPTLYTGGSDGSIIWWNLSQYSQEIKPIAILCGHASPIVDLGICFPITVTTGDEGVVSSSNVDNKSTSECCGALISGSTDGVLCVWSRNSGHCRRRRNLPPWAGVPSVIQTLPSNQRLVCIACCALDASATQELDTVDSDIGSELYVESDFKKHSKYTIVVVDTYTLTIVQTVFHGNLSIGPFKFFSVVPSAEDKEKHSALVIDTFGKAQLFPISKDSPTGGEGGGKLHSSTEMSVLEYASSNDRQLVSIATIGPILATIYRSSCTFWLFSLSTSIGEISFPDSSHGFAGISGTSQVIGGMFIERNNSEKAFKSHKTHEVHEEKFALWDSRGLTMVYVLSYLDNHFKINPMCVIPAVTHPLDFRLSIYLIQLNDNFLRVESVCTHGEEPLLWLPFVTIWTQQHVANGKLNRFCKMLGEGTLPLNFKTSSSDLFVAECSDRDAYVELNGAINQLSCNGSDASPMNGNCTYADKGKYGFLQKERVVSSSMVISEDLYTPYAVVYGFYGGMIEVVRFNMFLQEQDSHLQSRRHEVDSQISKQYFSGHSGAVLCLAGHQMSANRREGNSNHVLLSGGIDCTVRVWDLDAGNLIIVLHQHVAPVRQIVLPPVQSERPWNECFLTVGEDSCVALVSLESLRVERMFPGHPRYPTKVTWDGARGYIACLCQNSSGAFETVDNTLYIWDIKTGARERVIRGAASYSMFDNFCKGIHANSRSGSILNTNTSVSSLLHSISEDASSTPSHLTSLAKVTTPAKVPLFSVKESYNMGRKYAESLSTLSFVRQRSKHSIKCSCPLPGIANLSFDLTSLMSFCQKHDHPGNLADTKRNTLLKEQKAEMSSPLSREVLGQSEVHDTVKMDSAEEDVLVETLEVETLERCLLRFSLSFLHLWDVDHELDNFLITEMNLERPDKFIVTSGLLGDRGSLTLSFPGLDATLELWKSSSEFSAMRSLTVVSLAQRMISLSWSSTEASSALAAFYTRHLAEKIPTIKPPLLQLLVSFWQDETEHVRMAARSLFHCAVSRAIPLPLRRQKEDNPAIHKSSEEQSEGTVHNNVKTADDTMFNVVRLPEAASLSQVDESKLHAWLDSFEMQDWISCVGGTSQDAMTSHIIVAAALAIWYPSLVKPSLAMLVIHPLMKLVMAMNEKYSSTAAELLAEGMENTWKACIGPEIPRLIADIFFQIECVSSASHHTGGQNSVIPASLQETLVGVLLPSLAIADVPAFLSVIESQIWSTASDSPVHLVSLVSLIRVARGSPRNLLPHLNKAVGFILQTMDPNNMVMRRACLKSSMMALREVVHVFPMVALNETSTRLAVGDPIGDLSSSTIQVYDMQSVTKVKVLDASGPPGIPTLLAGDSENSVTTAISALSFSPDGEGLVAFSEHGLMIRWWSLGSAWWEKLSRNLTPIHCTKLIFVPPWEGFSPNSTRLSAIASVFGQGKQSTLQENMKGLNDAESLKLLIHNMDLSYQLEWVGERKVLLRRHGNEIGTFPL